MAGNRGGKKKTTKKSGKSTTAPVAEEHVEELSDGNNSDDMCDPPSERKRPSTGGGVSSGTRARKAVSNGNEPAREESNPVQGTTVVSLSLDTESEGMSAVSSKQKKIWWKELYESDVAARKFTKTKDKEKVTIVEGSSSNFGLESMLKGVEERIVKAMEEGFSGINLMVETKLEAMNLRMGKLEKYQQVLKKKAKKIEDKLTSIESKGNEDEEYTQGNDFDYGRDHGKDRDMVEAEKAETGKKISEKGEEDEENSGKDEGDEVRVQAEEFWRAIDDESEAEKEAEEEVEKKGEEEGEEEAEKEVQEEKEGEKEAEKDVQEEKEGEEEVESDVDQDVEEEEEKAEEFEDNPVENPAKKQTELAEKSVEVEVKTMRKPRAERLAKMRAEAEKKKAKAEKKKAKADGAPKKKGRPKKTGATLKPCTPLPEKRKSEPSRWVKSPFTEGKTDELEVTKKKLKTKI
ncbi:hypothetical protein Bca101_002910 [Brassica carinata]